jgi:hypothetical protein
MHKCIDIRTVDHPHQVEAGHQAVTASKNKTELLQQTVFVQPSNPHPSTPHHHWPSRKRKKTEAPEPGQFMIL